ncbi:MAG TPA: hypothetical protein VK066_28930 [Chloroflexota bacterium]|nr:hypothetical protein [Chloroflexota bacterium]
MSEPSLPRREVAEPARTARAPAPRVDSPLPPFLWTAVVLALVGGFALGGSLFLHQTAWRFPASQAHGHVQVFGWAGLLVLGVGLHFLPRLRGARLVAPGLVPWVLGLYASGLVVRLVAQPLAAFLPAVWPLLPLSGALEIAGAALAVGMLVATGRRGRPLRDATGLLPVLPYLVLAFTSLLVALVLNLAGLLVVGAPAPGALWQPLVPAPWDPLLVHLGLIGFLVPISLAMSVRTFPLYLRVKVPSTPALRATFAALLAGLVLRLAALAGGPLVLDALGRLLEGAALVAAAAVIDVPLLRTRAAVLAAAQARAIQHGGAPRPVLPPASDWRAADGLLRSAYAWLVAAAALLLVGAALSLAGAPAPPLDAERHALGAGFITLLIFGMGARLLPGFQGREHLVSARLVWATFWLGNAAALLRVGPLLWPWLLVLGGAPPTPPPAPVLALSGLLDAIAVAAFGWNLWQSYHTARR